MTIKLYLDNNVWDIFFDERIDFFKSLPIEEFSLQITREAEFEIQSMPREKRIYVENIIKCGHIITDVYFGFYDERFSPEEQRVSGFGEEDNITLGGRFIGEDEAAFIGTETRTSGSKKRPSKLFKNEADISLAARSLHCAVLTCDGKKALKRAKKICGGLVIDFKKYEKGTCLADFIKLELANLTNTSTYKLSV